MSIITGWAARRDIPAIAEIERESFTDPWSEDGFSSEMNNKMVIFLTAKREETGDIAGYVIGTTDGFEGYIEKIAVSGSARREGVGMALIERFRSSLLDTVDHISLEVRQSNSGAIDFYEKIGFEKAGVRKNFYSSPAENAIIYILDLRKE